VWYENKKGAWSAKVIVEGFKYTAATTGDVDKDGDPDLITNKGVWINEGKASSWRRVNGINEESTVGSMSVGDLDGDGDLDVISGVNPFGWWENTDGKGGAWSEKHIFSDEFIEMFLVFDVDGDRDLDIIAGDRAESESDKHELRWHENAGGGQWRVHMWKMGEGFEPWSLHPIDWDEDGDLDILLGGARKLAILENFGKGQFGAVVLEDSGNMVMAFQVRPADMDGDDDADLVVTRNFSGTNVAWLERKGDAFVEHLIRANRPAGTPEFVPIRVVDVDGDRDLDLIINDDYNVKVYRNTKR
jgi:hypothetical protein